MNQHIKKDEAINLYAGRLFKTIALVLIFAQVTIQGKSQYTGYTASSYISRSSVTNSFITVNLKESVPAKEDLLKRSHNLKTAAWTVLGTGTVVLIAGIISYPKEGFQLLFYSSTKAREQADKANIVTLTGTGISLCSIPFFIAAKKTKKKAKLNISNQKTSFALPPGYAKNVTGITATFRLVK